METKIYQICIDEDPEIWEDVTVADYSEHDACKRRIVVRLEHCNLIDVDSPSSSTDAVRQVVAACGRVWPPACQEYLTLGGHKVTPQQFADELHRLNSDPATCDHTYAAAGVTAEGVFYQCGTCRNVTTKLTKEDLVKCRNIKL